jgi:hypothetical protein
MGWVSLLNNGCREIACFNSQRSMMIEVLREVE